MVVMTPRQEQLERLRTSKHWIEVEKLEPGMKLDQHGTIISIDKKEGRRSIGVVTSEGGRLAYWRGEKALLAF